MSKLLTTVWTLAIFKGLNGWFIASAAVICAADPDWLSKSAVQILMALIAGSKFLEGFVDSTVQNLEKKRNPLGITYEETQFLKRDVTTPNKQ